MAIALGINPVHFGILIVVNMEVGMCHPPVGLNLYVASGMTKMGITELTIAVWPWLLTMPGLSRGALQAIPVLPRCGVGQRLRAWATVAPLGAVTGRRGVFPALEGAGEGALLAVT